MHTRSSRPMDDSIGLISVERNFEVWPAFCVQKDRRKFGLKLSVEDQIEFDGSLVGQRWTESASPDHGLLGPFDQDVYVATLALAELWSLSDQNNDNRLPFSIYGICKLLEIGNRGNRYEAVRASLSRIANTLFTSERAFWSSGLRGGEFLDDSFAIFGRRFRNWLVSGRSHEYHNLFFNEPYLSSYRSGEAVRLDFNLYRSLKRPLSRRLYRYHNQLCEEGGSRYERLSRYVQMIPLSADYKDSGQVRRKLEPAHEELVDHGFLLDVQTEGRGVNAMLIYRRRPDFTEKRQGRRLASILEGIAGGREAVEELLTLNQGLEKSQQLNRKTAEELVRTYGPEQCLYYLRHTKARAYRLTSPVGFLRKNLRDQVEIEKPRPSPPGREVSGKQTIFTGRIADRDSTAVGKSATSGTGELYDRDHLDHSPNDPPVPGPVADPTARAIWHHALDTLSEKLDAPTVRVWFEGTIPTGLEEQILSIVVPNVVAHDYITGRFKEPLESALASQLGEGAVLRILAADKTSSDTRHTTERS